jgi:hypothetical protein
MTCLLLAFCRTCLLLLSLQAVSVCCGTLRTPSSSSSLCAVPARKGFHLDGPETALHPASRGRWSGRGRGWAVPSRLCRRLLTQQPTPRRGRYIEFASFLYLRRKWAHVRRDFAVPGGWFGAVLITIPKVGLISWLCYTASATSWIVVGITNGASPGAACAQGRGPSCAADCSAVCVCARSCVINPFSSGFGCCAASQPLSW